MQQTAAIKVRDRKEARHLRQLACSCSLEQRITFRPSWCGNRCGNGCRNRCGSRWCGSRCGTARSAPHAAKAPAALALSCSSAPF